MRGDGTSLIVSPCATPLLYSVYNLGLLHYPAYTKIDYRASWLYWCKVLNQVYMKTVSLKFSRIRYKILEHNRRLDCKLLTYNIQAASELSWVQNVLQIEGKITKKSDETYVESSRVVMGWVHVVGTMGGRLWVEQYLISLKYCPI